MSVWVRDEQYVDVDAIRRIHERAFGQPQEGMLVDVLRQNRELVLSLVALIDHQIVGHIAFSEVRCEPDIPDRRGVGLAPMAVLPDFQHRGIGARLISEGADRLRERRRPYIVVVGHKEYYPRFGFAPASQYGVRCEWDVAPGAFMILPLDPLRLPPSGSLVRYRDEFAAFV